MYLSYFWCSSVCMCTIIDCSFLCLVWQVVFRVTSCFVTYVHQLCVCVCVCVLCGAGCICSLCCDVCVCVVVCVCMCVCVCMWFHCVVMCVCDSRSVRAQRCVQPAFQHDLCVWWIPVPCRSLVCLSWTLHLWCGAAPVELADDPRARLPPTWSCTCFLFLFLFVYLGRNENQTHFRVQHPELNTL